MSRASDERNQAKTNTKIEAMVRERMSYTAEDRPTALDHVIAYIRGEADDLYEVATPQRPQKTAGPMFHRGEAFGEPDAP
jgi:hypothetical protein